MDFKRFFSRFEGRTDGAAYWRAMLETAVSCVLFLLIFKTGLKLVQAGYLAIAGNPLPFDFDFSDALVLYAVWNAEFVAVITVKRLHDRNRSGWWIIPFAIAPPLLQRLWDWLDNPHVALVVSALGFGLSVWGVVELFCLRGARGPNRFGPDPLAPAPVAAGAASRWDQPSELEFVPHSAGPSPAPHVMRGHE
jgi:uncharacterized membrane protein YhaH (DUF805 family)